MENVSFKERVKNVAIEEAKAYRDNYIKYEYLIFSQDFHKKFYIMTGTEKNYLHLLGVNTSLEPGEFFNKCVQEKLYESDFDLIDKDGNDIRGTVRRKIKVLKNMSHLVEQKEIYVQENFNKNRVICTLGTTDLICTVGFIKSSPNKMGKLFPMTLMKGNELKNAVKAEILLRRKVGYEKFNEILIGNNQLIKKSYKYIKDVVAVSLYLNNKNSSKINRTKKNPKIPVCFQNDTYSEKLKRTKLKNKMR